MGSVEEDTENFGVLMETAKWYADRGVSLGGDDGTRHVATAQVYATMALALATKESGESR
jgi:hypothetical protein